ncbi:MAG: S8 family serine peptidase [Planctomycetes bacterium]|nr:S8 family serine peptidase [Planctomycetota bacterium]
MARFIVVGAVLSLCSHPALAVNLDQARALAREAIAAQGGHINPGVVQLRFSRGVGARVADGKLSLPAKPREAADLLSRAGWARAHHVDDAELNRQRAVAEADWGFPLPDLTQEFRLTLNPGETVEAVLTTLNTLPNIDYALPVPLPAPEPNPPSYQPQQRYLNPTDGVNVQPVWAWPGGTGINVRICDIEYSWNAAHRDLPPITLRGPQWVDPDGVVEHGTSVLGEMLARNNGWGTTGGAYEAQGYFAGVQTSAGGYNIAAAVTAAIPALRVGDIMVIEQQMLGPIDVIPVEWLRPTYDAIRQAVGNGIIVVAAAGNGNQDLDAAIYRTGNNGHWPFLAANDSGAIMVGAGAAPAANAGTDVVRSRLSFSNYGSRLNLQGWGEKVYTTGYGDLYQTEGSTLWYTSIFSGTSSATPIVASCVAQVQSVHKQLRNRPLSRDELKAVLRVSGRAQQAGRFPVSQKIGPMPDSVAALFVLFGPGDCNTNGRPDGIDILTHLVRDRNDNGRPDSCEGLCLSDFNSDGGVDGRDIEAFFRAWSAAQTPADVNEDGGVDGADISEFFDAWSRGVC